MVISSICGCSRKTYLRPLSAKLYPPHAGNIYQMWLRAFLVVSKRLKGVATTKIQKMGGHFIGGDKECAEAA